MPVTLHGALSERILASLSESMFPPDTTATTLPCGVALKSVPATAAAPAIASGHREMTIVASWGRDFPGLGISAQRLAARINEVSEGRIKTTYFAAGEKVGAFDVFDDVASGNSQGFISAAYYWKGKHPGFAYFCSVPLSLIHI